MMTNKRLAMVLNISLVLLLSLGLIGCSEDDPVSPQSTASVSFAETETYQEIAMLEGGRELLARIPEAEKRHHVHGARPLLMYLDNTIQPGNEEVEFPLNSSYFHYEGFGIPLGPTMGEGPSIENYATLTQVGSATLSGPSGHQIFCDYEGTFTMDQDTGEVEFGGEVFITGGTGPYEGAVGGGGYVGTASVFTATGQSVWYGYVAIQD